MLSVAGDGLERRGFDRLAGEIDVGDVGVTDYRDERDTTVRLAAQQALLDQPLQPDADGTSAHPELVGQLGLG